MSQDQELRWPVGHQLGLDLRRVPGMPAPFAHLAVGASQPVHGGLAAQIDPLVQQRGPHLRGRLVDEPAAAQQVLDARPFGIGQGVRWPPPRLPALLATVLATVWGVAVPVAGLAVVQLAGGGAGRRRR